HAWREEEGAGAAVLSGVVSVDAAASRLVDSPACECARDLLHVLLRVAAVNAQRVQLHQLARVVFVDAALRALLLLWSLLRRLPLLLLLSRRLCLTARTRLRVAHARAAEDAARSHLPGASDVALLTTEESAIHLRVGADALEVVEVEEHRRTLRRRFEEVAEVAERG